MSLLSEVCWWWICQDSSMQRVCVACVCVCVCACVCVCVCVCVCGMSIIMALDKSTWEHMLSKIWGCHGLHSLRPGSVCKGNDPRTCPFDQERMSTAYICNQTGGLHLTVRHVLHWLSLNWLSKYTRRVLAFGYPSVLIIQDPVTWASALKGPNPSEPQQQSNVQHSVYRLPLHLHW